MWALLVTMTGVEVVVEVENSRIHPDLGPSVLVCELNVKGTFCHYGTSTLRTLLSFEIRPECVELTSQRKMRERMSIAALARLAELECNVLARLKDAGYWMVQYTLPVGAHIYLLHHATS